MRHIKLSLSACRAVALTGVLTAGALLLAGPAAQAQDRPDRSLPPNVRAALDGPPLARGLPEHLRGALMLRPGALVFASFDQNADATIDAAELDAGLARVFAAADVDGSGVLTPLEYADWAARALGARDARPNVGGLDLDLDRVITRDEFERGFRETAALLAADPAAGLTIADLVEPVLRRVDDAPALADRDDGLEGLPRRP